MHSQEKNYLDEFVRRYWPISSDQPKHEKLRLAFANSIAEGYWPVGARLPTETELVSATPCSLGTVQRALRSLATEGIITRRRGSGSVVSRLGRRIEGPWHIRFFKDERKDDYLPVFTEVLDKQVITTKGPWSPALGQDSREVVKIERVFSVANEFNVYAIFYARADRFPDLNELPLDALHGTNLKSLIARQHHVPVHKVSQSLRFETPAPKWVSKNCNWPKETQATILNVVTYSLDGQAMYYQDFYIPPTKRVLDLGTPIFT